MRGLTLTLKALAIAFIATAALHLFFGLNADAMLGAPVSAEMVGQPSLDSQNRFYGIAFSFLGIALLISTTDLHRYKPVLLAALGVLFAAGLARILSWVLYGAPSPPIIGILCLDVLLPPLLCVWIGRSVK